MFEMMNVGGVCYLVSDKITSKHGFSTRLGGVSKLEHTRGLNLAFGKGDTREEVLKNVELFSNALSIDAWRLISVPQIHSADVRLVDMSHSGSGVSREAAFSCDGYVTKEKGLPIGVKTADCVPILLEARDESGNVIAVCAVHAGWRGTADKIAERGVESLVSLGAKKENIFVAIGPSINACCYEVGEDFACKINEKLGQSYENKFIKRNENGSLFADVSGMNYEILTSCGIPHENIDLCRRCTCCEIHLFYSHRGQKGKRGSMMNVICM